MMLCSECIPTLPVENWMIRRVTGILSEQIVMVFRPAS